VTEEVHKLWRILGGQGAIPSRAGCFSGPLLVLGGGRTVWDDYAKVRPWKGEIMAVNDVGAHLHERIRHWVTLHPEYLPGWRTYREKHNYGDRVPPMCHSSKAREGVDVVWAMSGVGGTSGLFACKIALLLGYTEIVLAGIPMTGDGHYFDPPWQKTEFADRANEQEWRSAIRSYFDGRVTSLSGRTREWIGATRLELVNSEP
jgi:hypothetical protein